MSTTHCARRIYYEKEKGERRDVRAASDVWPVMTSHYIPAFTDINGKQQRAACGEWVYSSQHSCEPACLGCQTWLTKDAPELDAAMEAMIADDVKKAEQS